MVNLNSKEANGLVLAYLGDSVWELFIRIHFINKGYNIKNLNKIVKEHVNAKIQSKYLTELMNELDDETKILINRARNSNIKTFPKSCTITEYRDATAFEALIGSLYSIGKIESIKNIIIKLKI